MLKRIWMSFDLGIKGNYEALYTWLSDHGARECGDGVATFQFDFNGEDYCGEVLRDLLQLVELHQRDRIYLVWEDDGIHGKFLRGSRKTAPWTGYGTSEPIEDE